MFELEIVTEYRKYFPQAIFLGLARDPYEAFLAGRAIHHIDPIELAKWVEAHGIPERVEFATGNKDAYLPVFRVQFGGRTEGHHQLSIPDSEELLARAFA